MKTTLLPRFALIPALVGSLILPALHAQEAEAAAAPKMEIEFNGRKIDMNQIRGLLDTVQIDEGTRQALRKHLDELAPLAAKATEGKADGNGELKVNGQQVDVDQLRRMAKRYLDSMKVDEETQRKLGEQLEQMAPLAQAWQPQGMPKVEVFVNGQKVELSQVGDMVKQAMMSIQVPEETKNKMRKQVAELREEARKLGEEARKTAEAGERIERDKKVEKESPRREAATSPGRPWKLGIVCAPVDEMLRVHLPIPAGTGMRVERVMDGSPAAKAGIKENDIITGVGKEPLKSYEQLVGAVARSGKTGEPLHLAVLKCGKPQHIVIKPDLPAAPERARRGPQTRTGPWGNNAPMQDWQERMKAFGEMRAQVERQEKEIDGLRKQLEQQREEMKKLRERIDKKSE